MEALVAGTILCSNIEKDDNEFGSKYYKFACSWQKGTPLSIEYMDKVRLLLGCHWWQKLS